ncbi:hypothetical protein BJX70DRAFT_401282 [Aspergillus crustosus]
MPGKRNPNDERTLVYSGKGLPRLRLAPQPTPQEASTGTSPQQEFLRYPANCLPKVRIGGPLPPRLEKYEYPEDSKPPSSPTEPEHLEHIEDVGIENNWLNRRCQSPVQLPEMVMPITNPSLELGLPGVDEISDRQLSLHFGGLPKPPTNSTRIYLGDNSPTPRWLIRPATPIVDKNRPFANDDSTPQLLGNLRWEFDPGPPERHGLDQDWLRSYAHAFLRNSLCDPIVRQQIKTSIRRGQFAADIKDVEDPLPAPPPPPHFKDKKPSDYVKLRPPVSVSAPDDRYFLKYPDYKRPPLARSHYISPPSSRYTSISDTQTASVSNRNNTDSSYKASSVSEGSRGRASTSTSSSASTNAKEKAYSTYDPGLDDENGHRITPVNAPKPPNSNVKSEPRKNPPQDAAQELSQESTQKPVQKPVKKPKSGLFYPPRRPQAPAPLPAAPAPPVLAPPAIPTSILNRLPPDIDRARFAELFAAKAARNKKEEGGRDEKKKKKKKKKKDKGKGKGRDKGKDNDKGKGRAEDPEELSGAESKKRKRDGEGVDQDREKKKKRRDH